MVSKFDHRYVGHSLLMGNGGCPANGWSIISSASTNSQLAGFLAGFVFSGITILAARPGLRNRQALTLFCCSFPVLGFDSYLFSLVSGGDADSICLRVWSQGEAASGMLGVGGLAVVVGVSWLLIGHLERDAGSSDSSEKRRHEDTLRNLDGLAHLMVNGVMVTITLLLTATALDYLQIGLTASSYQWARWIARFVPVVVASVALVAMWQRRMAIKAGRFRQVDQALQRASLGILIYAFVCPVFAGGVTNIPQDSWNSVHLLMVLAATIVGLIAPSLLLVLLVYATPPIIFPPAGAPESSDSVEVRIDSDPKNGSR